MMKKASSARAKVKPAGAAHGGGDRARVCVAVAAVLVAVLAAAAVHFALRLADRSAVLGVASLSISTGGWLAPSRPALAPQL